MDSYYSEAVADEIRKIEAQRRKAGFTLTPDDLVEASRSRRSHLHSYFLWDDDQAAAEKWRHQRARHMIQWVKVTYEQRVDGRMRSITVRQFLHNPRDGGYADTQSMLADEELRRLALSEARRDLSRFRSRYAHLSELSGLIQVIDELLEPVA